MNIASINLLRSKRWVPELLAIGLLSATAGCGGANAEGRTSRVPKVTTTDVVQQETTDFDEYTGRTEASETVEVRARVFGYLKTIDFKDGDFVKEGQTLFTIEPDEYDAIHKQSLSKIARLGVEARAGEGEARPQRKAGDHGRGQPRGIRGVRRRGPRGRGRRLPRPRPMRIARPWI